MQRHFLTMDELGRHLTYPQMPPDTYPNDSWILHNASAVGGTPRWQQLTPAGTLPAVRGNNIAQYDPMTRRLIIFGGGDDFTHYNDTWVLTNASGYGGRPRWTQLSLAGSLPPARAGMAGGYNSATNRLVITLGWGDVGALNDTWLLTDANGR